jgi:hypothetical protein
MAKYFFLRFGGTLPLFLIYFYIIRADIQYLYILLVDYHQILTQDIHNELGGGPSGYLMHDRMPDKKGKTFLV